MANDGRLVSRGWSLVRRFLHVQLVELSSRLSASETEQIARGIARFGFDEEVTTHKENGQYAWDQKGVISRW